MKRLVQGGSRVVDSRLLIDGQFFPGLVALEVSTNSHRHAGHFHIEMAMSVDGGQSADWWGQDARKGMLFDVRASIDGAETSLIVGNADNVDIQAFQNKMSISGRDLSANLIESRSQENFKGQTTSEIVSTLAKRMGLTPVIDSTSDLVDRFYQVDHDHTSLDDLSNSPTAWDLLTRLSRQEGYDIYVQGKELHFRAPVDSSQAEPYLVEVDANGQSGDVTRLQLRRTMKDTSVHVRSWHSGHGRAIRRHSPASANDDAIDTSSTRRVILTRPNLTEAQAQKLADNHLRELRKFDRAIELECPGELTLGTRDVIQLSGMGSWDQQYFIHSISRRLSAQGFTMSVTAKNQHENGSDV